MKLRWVLLAATFGVGMLILPLWLMLASPGWGLLLTMAIGLLGIPAMIVAGIRA